MSRTSGFWRRVAHGRNRSLNCTQKSCVVRRTLLVIIAPAPFTAGLAVRPTPPRPLPQGGVGGQTVIRGGGCGKAGVRPQHVRPQGGVSGDAAMGGEAEVQGVLAPRWAFGAGQSAHPRCFSHPLPVTPRSLHVCPQPSALCRALRVVCVRVVRRLRCVGGGNGDDGSPSQGDTDFPVGSRPWPR